MILVICLISNEIVFFTHYGVSCHFDTRIRPALPSGGPGRLVATRFRVWMAGPTFTRAVMGNGFGCLAPL